MLDPRWRRVLFVLVLAFVLAWMSKGDHGETALQEHLHVKLQPGVGDAVLADLVRTAAAGPIEPLMARPPAQLERDRLAALALSPSDALPDLSRWRRVRV